MIIICSKCKGKDIRQQGSVMVPINIPNSEDKADQILSDLFMEDYYWCMDCDEECKCLWTAVSTYPYETWKKLEDPY